MKRLVIRLSLLSAVGVSGLIAYAQTRFGQEQKPAAAPIAAATDEAAGAPEPIHLQAASGSSLDAPGNPLRRRPDLEEPGLPSRLGHIPRSHATPGEVDDIPPASVVLRAAPQRESSPHSVAVKAAPQAQADVVPAVQLSAAADDIPDAIAIPTDDLPVEPRSMPKSDRYGSVQPVANNEPSPTIAAPSTSPTSDDRYSEPARLSDTGTAAHERPLSSATPNQPNQLRANSVLTGPHLTAPTNGNPLREATPEAVEHSSTPVKADPRFAQTPPATNKGVRASSLPAHSTRAASHDLAAPVATQQPTALPATNKSTGEQGLGRPGDRQLEGPQAPSLVLSKAAPAEIQVGKECVFEIVIQNTGQIAAEEVEVLDVVPQGTELVATEPPAEMNAQGELLWQLGSMAAGAQRKLQVRLLPVAEGDIGSVATVRFQAQASARTIATRPQLKLELTAEPTVLIGEDIRVTIKLSNPGSGAATGVMLTENIPAGMKHPSGASLEFEVGTLAPGESRELDLVLTAEQAGQVENTLVAQAEANLQVEGSVQFEVVAPALEVALKGPKKRYLDRPATYEVSVSNPGTAAAQNVELTTYLPSGMKFVSANNAGTYDPQSHSVSWGLDELPANQAGSVELVAVPVEQGEQQVRVQGKANRGLSDQAEQSVDVEGVEAVLFTVADLVDPVEVGGETTYEIKVINQGSKASTNVQIVALLPPGMQPTAATGPARYSLEADRVVFAPLASLEPKQETTYKIKVKADRKGDQRVRVQLLTEEMQTPVTKEESTKVYADE